MARIAVVHPDFSVKGGAEAVSMNVLEALQADHDVTLFTTVRPDFDALNRYYNTEVGGVSVAVPAVNSLARRLVGSRFGLVQYAILNRAIRSKTDAFDLVVGTYNELAAGDSALLYVHHPLYRQPEESLDAREQTSARRAYERLCSAVAGVTDEHLRRSTVFANSGWMAKLVNRVYDADARPLYPPVDTTEFDPLPPDEQELGFVAIGRFAPDKNTLRNIEIIERVRERGHDVHLHLVGPSHLSDYHERVRRTAAEYDFVHVEEELPREELTKLVDAHRYGLHGKENEHFGMVVAEMLAGGAIPFVPNSGGQREIVDERPELLYDSVEGAVERIDAVLSDSALEAELRGDLARASERFGRARFRERIRETVRESVAD
ncbi:glycosyltransferase family 4 protein [Haladaptatus salinisoli]|uniref:glycosyltransferase family 4 protein n=1 Tax=Haladaptatus salinisoli TaxID=2884876 RepID=UPI001D09F9DB|nr:glycosyltransferase family 4 protein [Haladaptatus salinisoli]